MRRNVIGVLTQVPYFVYSVVTIEIQAPRCLSPRFQVLGYYK